MWRPVCVAPYNFVWRPVILVAAYDFGAAPPNSWECPDFGAARLPARRAVDDQRNGAFSELRIGGKVLRAAFR
jgi:hypothetical protein